MAMKTFKEYLGRNVRLEEQVSVETKKVTHLLVNAVYNPYVDQYAKNRKGLVQPIEAVGWLDGRANALRRNKVIFTAGIKENDSVLDVGCGVCHFYDYMWEHGWRGEYLGIDPNKKALDLVREDIDTRCGTIEDINGQDHMLYWDWVVASGVFNIGLKEEHTYWTIQNMIQHAKKGVVFNMLTYPYPDEQYEAYVPEEVKSKLMDMSKYTNIKIIEDYMPEEVSDAEFTIYFYV